MAWDRGIFFIFRSFEFFGSLFWCALSACLGAPFRSSTSDFDYVLVTLVSHHSNIFIYITPQPTLTLIAQIARSEVSGSINANKHYCFRAFRIKLRQRNRHAHIPPKWSDEGKAKHQKHFRWLRVMVLFSHSLEWSEKKVLTNTCIHNVTIPDEFFINSGNILLKWCRHRCYWCIYSRRFSQNDVFFFSFIFCATIRLLPLVTHISFSIPSVIFSHTSQRKQRNRKKKNVFQYFHFAPVGIGSSRCHHS